MSKVNTSDHNIGTKQVKRILLEALREADLDDTRAQRLLKSRDELQVSTTKLIKRLSLCDRYAGEEVASECGYSPEYQPRPIEEQIQDLGKRFGIDSGYALAYSETLPSLPKGLDYFAYVAFEDVAEIYFPGVTNRTEQYCSVQGLIIQMLSQQRRRFYSYYRQPEKDFTPQSLRMHPHTAHAYAVMRREQQGGILIIAAQLGLLHRGRSGRRAREVISTIPSEYGLDGIMGGCVALTHPKRFMRSTDLGMSCPGAKFRPKGREKFSRVFLFNYNCAELQFGAPGDDNVKSCVGAASGFLIDGFPALESIGFSC